MNHGFSKRIAFVWRSLLRQEVKEAECENEDLHDGFFGTYRTVKTGDLVGTKEGARVGIRVGTKVGTNEGVLVDADEEDVIAPPFDDDELPTAFRSPGVGRYGLPATYSKSTSATTRSESQA